VLLKVIKQCTILLLLMVLLWLDHPVPPLATAAVGLLPYLEALPLVLLP
jgi:hypothetical protein